MAHMRIIAASATLSNITDFATWLNVTPWNTMIYSENDWPIKLDKIVLGYLPK